MDDSTRAKPPDRPATSAPTVRPSLDDITTARSTGGRRELDGRKVMARFVGVIARIPRYVKLGWLLMNEPTVPARGKAALGGGLAYALSPIDPVPGFIPVLGQLDDMAALLLAIRVALNSAPAEVAEAHLREAGLHRDTLERDLVTIRATAIWVTRRGGALALRLGRAVLSGAARRLGAALRGSGSPDGKIQETR